ncbi:hypothetical protein ACFYNO_25790 [Kitasatospora sp. NPDC006697]|uniref:hypothetical protein n=1 Tax=Kitasatospora sp. NPDC006697 TaxID=3364020 RepID=UPI0036C926C0
MHTPDRSQLAPARIRPAELPAVLAEARSGGPVDHALVLLSLYAGLRPGEIADLAEGGAERTGDRWRVTVAGRRARTIAVPRAVGAALAVLAERRAAHGGPFLPTVRDAADVEEELHTVLMDARVADPRPFGLRAHLADRLAELAAVPTDHLFAYLGSAGVDPAVLPAGWDLAIAELIDRRLVEE